MEAACPTMQSTCEELEKKHRRVSDYQDNHDEIERMVEHLRPKNNKQEQQLYCNSCLLTNKQHCEWKKTIGVQMRVVSDSLKHKRKLQDWSVCYGTYRFYQHKMNPGVAIASPYPEKVSFLCFTTNSNFDCGVPQIQIPIVVYHKTTKLFVVYHKLTKSFVKHKF